MVPTNSPAVLWGLKLQQRMKTA